ncbi:CBS domain-containing protein [Marivita sp. GX14005]|uniref:CBS domain-containing protein n=1 Tax=Marivita sp. GX14005 TaxID=2942276 RepID=UPI00201A160D|nr:CBS domain-containing protein [Marivita sp. GX14005]MCL3882932.1 CBS domain-containing protein [Marivita sp. GX14005]
MKVETIMRRPITTVTGDTSIRAVAALMGKLDIGFVPICEAGRVLGVVTDRDIVTRWCPKACAGGGDGAIETIMTRKVFTCRTDQPLAEAAALMGDLQLRRLVVLDAQGALAGIVTLGDIAQDASEEMAGQTLGEIVELRETVNSDGAAGFPRGKAQDRYRRSG